MMPGDRAGVLRMAVVSRAGSDGNLLLAVYRTWHFVRGFELSRQERAPGFRAWPMLQGLAATLIHGEHQRATAAATGSREGATVGHYFRDRLFLMRALGWQAELDCLAVESAAPKAKAGGGRRSVAATMPLKLILTTESRVHQTIHVRECVCSASAVNREGRGEQSDNCRFPSAAVSIRSTVHAIQASTTESAASNRLRCHPPLARRRYAHRASNSTRLSQET